MTAESPPQWQPKTLGRLSLPEEKRDSRRGLLLAHYEADRAFWTDWLTILARYKRLIEALIRSRRRHPHVGDFADESLAWEALESAIDCPPVLFRSRSTTKRHWLRTSTNHHLLHYRDRVIDFAKRWGLRCEWAAAWIHASFLEWIQLIAPREYLEAIRDELPAVFREAIEKDLDRMPTERELRDRLRKSLREGSALE